MKIKSLALLLLFVIFVTGCTNQVMSQKSYNNKLRQIKLGIDKHTFYQVFPSAIPRGAKSYSNGIVEVLEANVKSYSFFPSGNPHRDELTGIETSSIWFYFLNDALIQYGKPNDWPQEPDAIIEIRDR